MGVSPLTPDSSKRGRGADKEEREAEQSGGERGCFQAMPLTPYSRPSPRRGVWKHRQAVG